MTEEEIAPSNTVESGSISKESSPVSTSTKEEKSIEETPSNHRYTDGKTNNHYQKTANGASSGYNGNNYNNRQYQQRGNRYINGNVNHYNDNRYNNNSKYNNYNNRNYNQQGAAGMEWSNYYAQPMYYMPQQMAMMNGGMYVDSNQYANGQPPQGTVNEASPSKTETHTRIQITTKTGELLDLNEIHSQKHHDETDETKKADSSNSINEATAFKPMNNVNDNEKLKTNEKNKEVVNENKETEAEKNKRLFLEQVRLRKLALDAKNKGITLESTEAPKAKETAPVHTEEKPEKAEEVNAEVSQDIESKPKHVQIMQPTEQETEQADGKIEATIPEEKEGEIEGEHSEHEEEEEDESRLTMTQLLDRLKNVEPIEDIFSFKYPEPFVGPEIKYKKEKVKYSYGPLFLLQFKDPSKVKADDEWVASTKSKIVIPPGMGGRASRPRDNSRFGSNQRNQSNRNTGNSRNSSRRQSKKYDDRKSNRTSYTSRKDREKYNDYGNESRYEDSKPKEEVAPFVPTANRWIPKSKLKKIEKLLAPDGVTELVALEDIERTMKSLLNKLTLDNFDTIAVDILNLANQSKWETEGETLQAVILQIFLKATDEPYWSTMYAQLCGKIVKDLDPEIKDENHEGKVGPKLVLHYLVDICHTEFAKGWADKLPTNEDGTPLEPEMMSDEYYQAAAAKRRGLGLVRFIGFLYRLNLLTGKMMFECFRRLMKDLTDNPSEEVLESVVELLSTVGEQFETDSFSAGKGTLEGSVLLDSLFGILQSIIDSDTIASRLRFKLMDIRELRNEKHWDSEKKDAGPKTIQQIHEEEEKARRLKSNSRAPSRRTNNSNYNNNNSNYNNNNSNYNNNNNSNYSRGTNRNNYRRDAPRDNFQSTRSASSNFNQKPGSHKEEAHSRHTNINRFSALLHEDDDE